MAFDSLAFALFLAAILALHRLPLPWTLRKANLLAASYLFYAAWNPPFAFLLALSTSVDWLAVAGMARARGRGRRALLVLSLAVNLGMLGVFKYGGFVAENLDALLGTEFTTRLGTASLVLPVGISFYTFQSLSYTIDVYRERIPGGRSLLDFALFVSFFPQLVAGPIVRAAEFLPQCEAPHRPSRAECSWGLSLLVSGLFAKVVLADAALAPTADLVYASPAQAGLLDAWAGTFAFALQIFFDFSGYSACAIGVALLLGFELPDNFRRPYAAIGFSDFWRRWHISLSSWLRDYLYIPLGGNRRGAVRTYLNLLVTMLLGGLWHGAAWRFVVWGALHGLYLAVERLLRARWAGPRRALSRWAAAQGTFLLVCLTWVFFRATDLGSAMQLVQAMLGAGRGWLELLTAGTLAPILVLTALVSTGQWLLRDVSLEETWGELRWGARALLLAGMTVAIALAPGDDRAFIYFQF